MIHPIQFDRHDCEVPNHKNCPGTDWDHCIFTKNKRFKKFVNNPLNMLKACAIANRITKETDRWNTKKWLIDHHLEHNRKEFLKWIRSKPTKLAPDDLFRIYTYINGELTTEERTK